MSMLSATIILIAGPTASGKSTLAANLAAHFRGMVINCDAMQVYRDLPILTAQPDAKTLAQAPHQLYATIDPAQAFSAGQWLTAAKAHIAAARAQGMLPIVTGGTGMYFQSLLNGLAAVPPIPVALRQQLHADYTTQGEAAIRARLAQHDPAAATRILPGDQLRLLRALEIVLATGKTQHDWQQQTSGGIGRAGVIPLLLLPPRAALYQACDQRFERMLQAGAMAEVHALLARQLDPQLPAMKIIGVPEIAAFLAGTYGWDECVRAAQQATRNYAKRQLTWFRNQWQSNKIGFENKVFCLPDFFDPAGATSFSDVLNQIDAQLIRR